MPHGNILRLAAFCTALRTVDAQAEGVGVLGSFDMMMPEQQPGVPMTSLIMLYLVIALILGEMTYNIYTWFDKQFGDHDEEEKAEDQDAEQGAS